MQSVQPRENFEISTFQHFNFSTFQEIRAAGAASNMLNGTPAAYNMHSRAENKVVRPFVTQLWGWQRGAIIWTMSDGGLRDGIMKQHKKAT